MHDIVSAAQPDSGDYVMACGMSFFKPEDYRDPRTYATLANFKRTTGEIVFIRTWGAQSFTS